MKTSEVNRAIKVLRTCSDKLLDTAKEVKERESEIEKAKNDLDAARTRCLEAQRLYASALREVEYAVNPLMRPTSGRLW